MEPTATTRRTVFAHALHFDGQLAGLMERVDALGEVSASDPPDGRTPGLAYRLRQHREARFYEVQLDVTAAAAGGLDVELELCMFSVADFGSRATSPRLQEEAGMRAMLDRYVASLGLEPGIYTLFLSEGAWRRNPEDCARLFLAAAEPWTEAGAQRPPLVMTLPCRRLGPGQFGAYAARDVMSAASLLCTYDAGAVAQLLPMERGQSMECFSFRRQWLDTPGAAAAATRDRNVHKFSTWLPTPDDPKALGYNVLGNPFGICPGPMINSAPRADDPAINCGYTVMMHVASTGRATLRTMVTSTRGIRRREELVTYYGDGHPGVPHAHEDQA